MIKVKNQYFLKDKKALIYDAYYVTRSGAMTKVYYYPRTASEIWCYASQLSQDTIFEAKSFGEEETRFFVFNQGTTVELYDLILYRSKWYEVTRVDTTDDYNSDVFVYAKDAPIGTIPKEDRLRPYGWTIDNEN